MKKLFITFIFLLSYAQYYSIDAAQIQSLSVPNWGSTYAKNGINNYCKVTVVKNITKCTGICPLTNKLCRFITNFNEPVCGCMYCLLNYTTKQCFGQCSNTLLETCVSKKPVPSTDSDCVCVGCQASNIKQTTPPPSYVPNYYDDYAYNDQGLPSCNASSCYPGNSCSFFYATKNRVPISDSLYCKCNNDNTLQTGLLLLKLKGKK